MDPSTNLNEQIKQIENKILYKIEKYNQEINAAEVEENKLRVLQSKAYILSERQRKAKDKSGSNSSALLNLENQLNALSLDIQSSLNDTLEAKSTALVSMQSLYREHVGYLSDVINGLKLRCDKLESALRQKSAQVESAPTESAPTESAPTESVPVNNNHLDIPDNITIDAAQVDAAQVDAAQVDAVQVDAAQVDAAQVDAAQVDAAQVVAAQVVATPKPRGRKPRKNGIVAVPKK